MWNPASLSQVPPHQIGPTMGARPAGLGGSMPMARQPGGGVRKMYNPGTGDRGMTSAPMIQQLGQQQAQQAQMQAGAGVHPGQNMMGGPAVPPPGQPSLDQIQAEMARRQVGAQLGPRNGALSGYMMGR